MRIGACVAIESIASAKKAGFDFVELSAMELRRMEEREVELLAERLRQLSVPALAVNMYCDETLFTVNSDPDQEAVMGYAEGICRKMHILGMDRLGIGAPSCRRAEESTGMAAAEKRLLDVYTWSAQTARKYDITVLIEPVNHYFCNVVNTVGDAERLLTEASCDHLRLLVDFCHAALQKEKEEDLIAALAGAAHVHVGHQNTENMGRDYLRDRDESELTRQMKMLVQAGYRGDISMEAGGKDHVEDGLAASAAVLKRCRSEVVGCGRTVGTFLKACE
ncbi:MAG: sugar phosphate isomerase/epimerase [Lachnospiraceae bacterium]|nr:sugar phosphate isomerase/epimerase [Lachnospiraceae bacterium]